MYRMLAAIAEFQRDLISANTREGLAAARARGRRGGRKPKLTAAQVQLAQQLYDAGDKTVAEIAALFTVPRTTIYGHLAGGSTGARPRARKLPVVEPEPAETSAFSLTAIRPKPARIPLTDEPPTAQELQPRQRLVAQRQAMRASRRPTCGNEPVDAQTRWSQRQDLATIWLHLDGTGEIHEQRHCVACQPHQQILLIECDRCGDGPLVTGVNTDASPKQRPTTLTRWLHNNGWRTHPARRCGNHR